MLKEAILILLVVFAVGLQCNGTTGNFISEHSLGQQDEINDTTVKICPTIQIKNVANTFDQGSINLSNITLSCLFFDGSQVGKAGNSSITVSGGRIEFQTNFAITVNQSGTVKNGTGYGKSWLKQHLCFLMGPTLQSSWRMGRDGISNGCSHKTQPRMSQHQQTLLWKDIALTSLLKLWQQSMQLWTLSMVQWRNKFLPSTIPTSPTSLMLL